MNPEEYERMFDLEDHYWWFVGRRHVALHLLRDHLRSGSVDVLDLGCGTGVISREMAPWARVFSLDMSPLALAFCAKRDLPRLVQARGEALPLAPDSMDGVIGLDIFEHIEDDMAAFREAYRVLKPGGVLVLSVPAFKSLWGPHDVALHHFRRYRRPELRRKLLEVGFEIPRLSYSVFFLFPVVVIVRIFEKRKTGPAKASLVKLPPWANNALIGLQKIESFVIRRMNLPWGSSLLAVARKPH